MLGQAFGPVFGGILTEFQGYQSIFWFLFILSGFSFLSILFLLPETMRCIAGDGTVLLTGIHKPFIYMIKRQDNVRTQGNVETKRMKFTFSALLAPLRFLTEKDVFITLFLGSIIYTVWSMVTSSTTALFQEAYGLNALQIGLTFLGNGMWSNSCV